MAEDEPPRKAPKLPEDVRIESLEERLRRAQEREADRTKSGLRKRDENEAQGGKVMSYLLGGLIGGTLIGWGLDRVFETDGLLLIIGLVLGIIGGFWSIIRVAMNKPPTGLD